jgi:phosphoribosylformylglycinamidine cyclo-ligase
MSETDAPETSRYVQAGVDIAAGNRAVELMRDAVRATHGPEVLAGVGAFGGVFDAARLKAMQSPLLVASTDGVGTKVMVAARMNRWDTVGQDLVNHCVNDILVQGARPLFFMDYVASGKLEPEVVASVVSGMAVACRQNGCALLGGETAEMPGVYRDGELDVAGTIVGVLERSGLIDGSRIREGDAILALPSSGLHTNGYSLARRALEGLDWAIARDDLNGQSVGDALLAVHCSYLEPVTRLLEAGVDVRGLAHITGGGVIDNLPRIFADGIGAVVRRGSWPEPPIFKLIQMLGDVSAPEMFHAFNMGLGMLVVVPIAELERVQGMLECFLVGEIVAGSGVRIEGI